MYTLRIIEENRDSESKPFEQIVSNFELGNSYSTIRRESVSEFTERIKYRFPEAKLEGIRMFLCGQNGNDFFIMDDTPLQRNDYFIMTDNGKTFERL